MEQYARRYADELLHGSGHMGRPSHARRRCRPRWTRWSTDLASSGCPDAAGDLQLCASNLLGLVRGRRRRRREL